MELVDLYNEDRIPLGRTAERHARRRPGEYRLVVHVCIFNRKGQLLIQQRSPEKGAWPGLWDVSAAGGVSAGETSRQAAEREVMEELGYPLDLTGVRPSLTAQFQAGFDDFYMVVREVDLRKLTLQKEEVSNARWASREEVLSLLEQGKFIDYPRTFLNFLFEMKDTFGLLA